MNSSQSLAGELGRPFGWPRTSTGLCHILRSLLVITNISWLWQSNRYVALKITNCFEGDRKSANKELKISQHIEKIQSKHQGRAYVRQDLKGDNFLLGFEDRSVIDDYIRQQKEHPSLCKQVDGRPIYQSRPDFGGLRKGVGLVKISDFGAAVFGNVSTPHCHDIQPEQFCAPEVLLKASWTYSVDIWNLGMVVSTFGIEALYSYNAANLYFTEQLWELLKETSLLDGIGPESERYSREAHFAQMISLLGPPPQELLDRADSTVHSSLYNAQGEFRYSKLIPSPAITFSNRTPFLQGEDKRLFIEFASKMLRWLPEDRLTAIELYDDPWLSLKPEINQKSSG
ncbi:MAG: hypothetical protein Q9163_001789 [Psora crenata]